LHNAIDDVKILNQLLKKIGVSEIIKKNSKSHFSIFEERRTKKLLNKNSLGKYKDVLSVIINKMAASDSIIHEVMQQIFYQNGQVMVYAHYFQKT